MNRIVRLDECPQQMQLAADWFSRHWQNDSALYFASMRESLQRKDGVPRWWIVTEEDSIIAGAGVIANDFHQRPDLTPNVCALFVEPAWRGRGLARRLLETIRQDCAEAGIARLYLISDHVGFYEKCGWQFLRKVQENDGHWISMFTILCEGGKK